MSWVFIYLVIGAIVSVLTWLYYTSNWCNREIHEGHVIVYLLFCTLLWPLCIISAFYELYCYLKRKWDF